MIDFVWNDVLLNPMINALVVLSHVLFDNFGLAIIAFTILIRGATYPLTRRQLRTTRAMQEMQPRLQEIQKKYKDPKRRQQEMMRVYREVGFNPLGCAVPLLVQLPIWIALFQVIRRTMSDTPEALLSLAGRLYEWDFITAEIPLNRTFLFMDLSKPSIPLVVLVGLATFYQQKMSTSRAASTGGEDRSANTNRMLIWMMPLMFAWFTLTVPSGLGLYWFITGLFGLTTAYIYNRPKGLTRRWLISLDGLPPRTPAVPTTGTLATAIPAIVSGDDTPTKEESPAPAATGAQRTRRRRRRRRRGSGSTQ